jgi:hypothetical protein
MGDFVLGGLKPNLFQDPEIDFVSGVCFRGCVSGVCFRLFACFRGCVSEVCFRGCFRGSFCGNRIQTNSQIAKNRLGMPFK